MDRREFLKTAAVTAVAAGIFDRLPLGAAEPSAKEEKADLVAIRGTDPGMMFDTAIAALGGMKAFVKPGQKVVVKPNIGWDALPSEGADTNPELVARIVKRALEAGAAKVLVFDHTCDRNWVSCYKRSGIREAVESAGGVMVTGNDRSNYAETAVPKALSMKSPLVCKTLLEADVVINVPVLKSHGGAKMTCAMKNYMGVVWDRPWMHKHDLPQCIADSIWIRKPDLNVVDAMLVMTKGGPTGKSPKTRRVRMNSLLLSTDIVAVDTAAAKMLGVPLSILPYLAAGEKFGFGSTDLNKIRIKKIG